MAELVYADLIGKPFAYGGRGPDSYDCFGLLLELQRRLGGPEIPDLISPTTQNVIALRMRSRINWWQPEARPFVGAHLWFRIGRNWSHCGVYLGDDLFIHCWEKSGGVCTERLSDWSMRTDGAFYRFVG